MRDNLFVYILIVLFAGFGIYWTVCTYQSDKEEIALSNSPMNTSCEAFTKDAMPCVVHGKLYYDPKCYSIDEAIDANYLIKRYLYEEINKHDRQDFLNDSIIKSIFNIANEELKQEYPEMYWSCVTIYINDPEWYKTMQKYGKYE